MGFEPQRARRHERCEPGVVPPSGLVAAAVNFAVVSSTQWDRELIAYLAPERGVLREPQVVSIRGSSAADQTSLLGNKFDAVSVTKAAWLGMDQLALLPFVTDGLAAGSVDRRSTDEDV